MYSGGQAASSKALALLPGLNITAGQLNPEEGQSEKSVWQNGSVFLPPANREEPLGTL